MTTSFLGVHYKRNSTSDKVIVLSLAQNRNAQFVGGLLLKLLLLYQNNNFTVSTDPVVPVNESRQAEFPFASDAIDRLLWIRWREDNRH